MLGISFVPLTTRKEWVKIFYMLLMKLLSWSLGRRGLSVSLGRYMSKFIDGSVGVVLMYFLTCRGKARCRVLGMTFVVFGAHSKWYLLSNRINMARKAAEGCQRC